MKHAVLLLALVVGPVAACDGGTEVALNERQFLLPTMEAAAAGCVMHQLGGSPLFGGGGQVGGGGGGPDGIFVSNETEDDHVLIQVSHDGVLLAERRYDEAFFRSQRVDQFVATAPTGASHLLRFWGTFDKQGNPVCAPFEDLGER